MKFQTVSGATVEIRLRELDHAARLLRAIRTRGGATIAAGAVVRVEGSGRIIYVKAVPCQSCGQQLFSCHLRSTSAQGAFVIDDTPGAGRADEPLKAIERSPTDVHGAFASFGEMTWVRDSERLREADWRARHGEPTREDITLLSAAATDYLALLAKSAPEREAIIGRLRGVADGEGVRLKGDPSHVEEVPQ